MDIKRKLKALISACDTRTYTLLINNEREFISTLIKSDYIKVRKNFINNDSFCWLNTKNIVSIEILDYNKGE